MLPSAADERPFSGDQAFLFADRFFVQSGGRQIPFDAVGADSLAFEAAPFGRLRAS